MNIPNKLTTIRFITIPLIIIALYIQTAAAAYFALVLLIIAWITDLFDGIIARKAKLRTKFGAFFDPFVDKILVSFVFIAMGDLGLIPIWIVILMLFRDYLTQGIRSMVKAEGIILKSEWSGKIKFILQMTTIVFATFLFALSFSFSSVKAWMYLAIFIVMVISTIEAYYALFEFLYKNRKVMKKWF